jgi:L-lactate dehydrogenase (cytochrome)
MQPSIPYFDRRYPDFACLREKARHRMPVFAFDFVDTGAGRETGVRRNAAAFDNLELAPRFGGDNQSVLLTTELFGQTYQTPIGIAPMGLSGLAWPGADAYLAEMAQKAGIPYVLATGASLAIEKAAKIAPDRLWFQLYKIPGGNGRIQDGLVARALKSGAKALVLTIDSSARASRPRDQRNGLVPPFSLSLKLAMQAALAPSWMAALVKHGVPKFENLLPYLPDPKTAYASAAFTVREVTGAFNWAEINKLRRQWPHALVVKGLTHPEDAENAVKAGADGIWLSNHGGRVFDPSPATIDILPEVRAAIGDKAKIIIDSGIRDGVDVVRALALGADFCFAGRAFLFAVAALGEKGAAHMATIFSNDITNTMKFLGKTAIGDLDPAIFYKKTAR